MLVLLLIYQLLFAPSVVSAASVNGFDLSNSEIPMAKIKRGGPPRDGIPAISHPKFIDVTAANNFLNPADKVMGLSWRGENRAYPVKILNYHEIVNDTVAGENILVSYCPLCGTGMVFHAKVNDRDLNFGVSGLLYNSDVLMYDKQTESLWSQILGQAISGPSKGSLLQQIPVIHTSWQQWKALHPGTTVLSNQTGYRRDYSRNPYAGYAQSNRVWFPVVHKDNRYPNKEWVIAISSDGHSRAWPFSELEKYWQTASKSDYLPDEFNGKPIKIRYLPDSQTAYITDNYGNTQSTVVSFWFAWVAFHPNTEVFVAE